MSSSMNSNLGNFKREFRGRKVLFLSNELEIFQTILLLIFTIAFVTLTSLDVLYSLGVAFLLAIAIMNLLFNSKLRVYVVDYKGVSLRIGFIQFRLFKFVDIKDVYVQKYTNGYELIFVEIKNRNNFGKERIITCENNLALLEILNDWKTADN